MISDIDEATDNNDTVYILAGYFVEDQWT